MRVTNPTTTPAQTGNTASTSKAQRAQKSQETDEAKKASGAEATEGAKTEISARGKDMAKAKAVASDTSDVRENKIAALKKRIAEGRYSVDADKIAEKLVDEHLKSGIG